MEYKVPANVKKSLKLGLKLYHAGLGDKGLVNETIEWAEAMADGVFPSEEKIIKMRNWFARHGAAEAESKARRRQEAAIVNGDMVKSPAYVAWLLWGGDAGREWVNDLIA